MRGRTLAVLLTAPFMTQADATIANVATPSIHAELGASGSALELVIGGYLVAFAVLVITGARLGQTHGYRRVFLAGVAAFTGASLLCGLAPSPAVLVIARMLQGAGAALMFPQALTGIQQSFDGAQRKRVIARYAIALSSGAVVGQLLGGALIVAHLTADPWRAIFLVNVPVGVGLLIAAACWLPPDGARIRQRADLRGVATLSISVLLVIVPLVLGRATGWPAWTWLCLAASVPAFAAFIAVERRRLAHHGAPLVNVSVIARPPTAWGLGAMLVATGTYYALLFTLAQYLQAGLGRSPLISGLTLVPWVVAFGLAGQVARRVPARVAACGGCVLLGGAYLAISIAERSGVRDGATLVVLLLFGGFGLGVQFSALLGHLTTTAPPHYAPDISGVTTTTLQIGGALGVAAFGSAYLGLASAPGATHATHAFADVTAALAVAALLAAAMAYRSTRSRVIAGAGDVSSASR